MSDMNVNSGAQEAINLYVGLMNDIYEEEGADVSVTFNGDQFTVVGTDVEGQPINQNFAIDDVDFREIQQLVQPTLEEPTATPITWSQLQDIKGTYFDSSVLTVVAWMIVEINTELTKMVRNQETEFAIEALKMMKDAVEVIKDLKEKSAELNYEAAIAEAEAKIISGYIQIGTAAAGIAAGGVAFKVSGFAAIGQSLATAGSGAGQIVEGNAGVDAAEARLQASMLEAMQPVYELLKSVLEQARSQAREAISDYVQNLQNVMSRHDQLMDQIARDNRLNG